MRVTPKGHPLDLLGLGGNLRLHPAKRLLHRLEVEAGVPSLVRPATRRRERERVRTSCTNREAQATLQGDHGETLADVRSDGGDGDTGF